MNLLTFVRIFIQERAFFSNQDEIVYEDLVSGEEKLVIQAAAAQIPFISDDLSNRR